MRKKRLMDLFPGGSPDKQISIAIGRFSLINETLYWFLSTYKEEGFNLLRVLAFPIERVGVGMAFLVSIWEWSNEGSFAATLPVISGSRRIIEKGAIMPEELLSYLRREGDAGARLIADLGGFVGVPPASFLERTFYDHFLAHRDEVGASDPEEYLKKAIAIAGHPIAKTFLAYHPEGGSRRYHLLEVGGETFLVAVNSGNFIVTFFRGKEAIEDILKRSTFHRPLFLIN